MPQTVLSIRIDEELKKEMEEVCKELGMNMTTAITLFAKKLCREKRIPFEISIDPFFSESNMKALRSSIADIEAGRGLVVKTMAELEAMEND